MKRADIERCKPRPSGGPSWIHHGKKMGGALVGVFLRAGLADDRLALDEDLHGEATILADEYALHLAPGPKDPKDQRFLQLAREVFTMLMDPTGLPTTAADRAWSELHSWLRSGLAIASPAIAERGRV